MHYILQDLSAAWEAEAAEALAGEGAEDVHDALGVGRHEARRVAGGLPDRTSATPTSALRPVGRELGPARAKSFAAAGLLRLILPAPAGPCWPLLVLAGPCWSHGCFAGPCWSLLASWLYCWLLLALLVLWLHYWFTAGFAGLWLYYWFTAGFVILWLHC